MVLFDIMNFSPNHIISPFKNPRESHIFWTFSFYLGRVTHETAWIPTIFRQLLGLNRVDDGFSKANLGSTSEEKSCILEKPSFVLKAQSFSFWFRCETDFLMGPTKIQAFESLWESWNHCDEDLTWKQNWSRNFFHDQLSRIDLFSRPFFFLRAKGGRSGGLAYVAVVALLRLDTTFQQPVKPQTAMVGIKYICQSHRFADTKIQGIFNWNLVFSLHLWYIELLKLLKLIVGKKTLWQKWVKSNMFKHLFLFPFIGHFFTEFANSSVALHPEKANQVRIHFSQSKNGPKVSTAHRRTFSSLLSKHKTPTKPTEPTTSMNPSINQASKQTTQTTKQLSRPVAQGPRSVYPYSWSVGRHRPRLSKRGVEGDPCDSDEAGEPPPWEIGDQSFGPNIPPRLFFVNVEIGDCLEVLWLEIGTKVRVVKVNKSSIK